ncbi:MAG: polysaccharide deacetylase family protein [bacterium]|nr:polysaccharide deacetylase family protein [bacterium]
MVPRSEGTLTVGMFHHTADTALFESQLEALLAGRIAVSGMQVVTALKGGEALPAGALWITFDDAYGDFLEVAWPVLERKGLPVTQFVATDFVGSNPSMFWWDRLESAFEGSTKSRIVLPLAGGGTQNLQVAGTASQAHKSARTEIKRFPHGEAMAIVEQVIESLGVSNPISKHRVLSWDELESLHGCGMEVGVHTRSHAMLDRIPAERVEEEIAGGLEDLKARFADVLPVLAYPSGQFDLGVMRVAEHLGMEAALTVDNGINRMGSLNPFEIRRVPIGPFADASAVRLRMLLGRLLGKR